MAGMMPTPASANSPPAYTILDVDQNAYLFVGGIFGKVKVPPMFSPPMSIILNALFHLTLSLPQKAEVVRTSTFTGCMGETFLDGKPIGLWNYRQRQGDCKGCVVRYSGTSR